MIDDAWREECARAAATRRDNIRARADRPSQRRCAPERSARGVILAPAKLELRGQADAKTLEFVGIASAYERAYEMWDMWGPYTEIVSAGAGEASLKRGDLDVPLVLNHDSLRRIARTTNGSLLLSETDEGLNANAPELDAADVDVAYIAPKIRSGLIDEMSFKFRIEVGQWSPDYTEFRINVYDIHRGDTAIVGYGANPHTSTTLRAQPAPSSRLVSLLDLAIAG